MQTPSIPQFPNFSSDRVSHFFKLWELLNYEMHNPIHEYTSEIIDSASLSDLENDERLQKAVEIVNDKKNKIKIIQDVLNEENELKVKVVAALMELDQTHRKILFSEKDKVLLFFKSILDQVTFNSDMDHLRIRKFIIDWYTAQRTIVTKSRNAIDPYSLTDEELNTLILGFGYPYPYEIDETEKGVFLHELINYYHHKGSPKVLGDVLTFYGMVDTVICEWWLYRNGIDKTFWMKSTPVWPKTEKYNSDYIISTPYEAFVRTDPHWHYDKDGEQALADVYYEPDSDANGDITSPDYDEDYEKLNKISLPSITPYISLNNIMNDKYIKPELSILNRKVQEAYEFWMEYILTWKGTCDSSSYPTDSSTGEALANWVVLNNTTNTHHVYNGYEWIDLECRLPKTFIESEPNCNGQTEFRPDREIGLSINGDERFSLLESMLGSILLLNTHFGLYSKRMIPDPDNPINTWEDLLDTTTYVQDHVIYPVEQNMVARVLSTGNDAIYFNNTWHDLGYATNWDNTSGTFTFITYVPSDLQNPSNYFFNSHLEYNGKYAPLDKFYDIPGVGYLETCKDGIDDVAYDNILEEWDSLQIRPKDTPDPYQVLGINGDEVREYYTAWQQRKEKVEDLGESFYRKYGQFDEELFTHMFIMDNSSMEHGWYTGYDDTVVQIDSTNGYITITDDASVPSSEDIIFYQFFDRTSFFEYPVDTLKTGLFDIGFDLDITSGEIGIRFYALDATDITSFNIVAQDTYTISKKYSFNDIPINELIGFSLFRSVNTPLNATIKNISLKYKNIEKVQPHTDQTVNYFSFGQKIYNNDDETLIGNMTPGWISVASDSTREIINIDTTNYSIHLQSRESSGGAFNHVCIYLPYGKYGTSFVLNDTIPYELLPEDDVMATLSFDITKIRGPMGVLVAAGTALISDSFRGEGETFGYITETGSYSIQIQANKAKAIIFLAYSDDFTETSVVEIKIENIALTALDYKHNSTIVREHFHPYSNARIFLNAMNPALLQSIESQYFVLGMLYSENMKRFAHLQEKYFQDLGLYLKETLGLTHLLSLANFTIGLAIYREIKKVINYFKPYRVRFRSMMTEYKVENPIDDGSYCEDHIYLPRVSERLQDVNYTNEILGITPVLLFEEAIYRYGTYSNNNVYIGGPGVYDGVFDGIERPLYERLVSNINQHVFDHVNTKDILMCMTDDLHMADVGPYNFDEIRATDSLGSVAFSTQFTDNYRDYRLDINNCDHGYIEVYDYDGTNVSGPFNYVGFNETPTLNNVIDMYNDSLISTDDSGNVYIRKGVLEFNMQSGFSEVSGIGTDWSYDGASLVSVSNASRALIFSVSETEITTDNYYISDTPGLPFGYFTLNIDIEVVSLSTDTTIGLLFSQERIVGPDALAYIEITTPQRLTLDEVWIGMDSTKGFASITLLPNHPSNTGQFEIKIHKLEVNQWVWGNNPIIKEVEVLAV